jgi:hypothetical protein
MWEKLETASQMPSVGAICIGLAVYLIGDHFGVTGWESHAIPDLTAIGCYVLANSTRTAGKNSN